MYLARHYGEALGPIGGWRQRGTSAVIGKARAATAWKDNSSNTWLAIGTHNHLYVSNRNGDLYDITPAGFVAGLPDATGAGGFGSGYFGAETFGTPRPDTSIIQDATEWTLDTWGEQLVGVSPSDGKMYQWYLNTAAPATRITNSPLCDAIVVTPERFLFALGAGDHRTVAWCDQEKNTVWAINDTTQAGTFPIQTGGRLMCGKVVRGGTLIFTDVDVHLATYIGGNGVYSFDKIGDACGAISRQATVAFDMQAFWMSPSGFWLYNGYLQKVPCDVFDYVYRDINMLQASKVSVTHLSQFTEIEIRYCSGSSNELDRCVVWNYETGRWYIGRPIRLCGVDFRPFSYPIMIGSDGVLYEHEVGNGYDGDEPYATTGPIELGNGDQVMHVTGLIPDDATVGDVTATFYLRNNPDDDETVVGPFPLSSKTDLRFCARQTKVRYTGVRGNDFRVGTPRLGIVQGGSR